LRLFVAFYGKKDNPAPALEQKTRFSDAFLCAGSVLAFFSRLASVAFRDLGAGGPEIPFMRTGRLPHGRSTQAKFLPY